MQRVNLTSVYLCCKYAIPYMQRQGKGSIINTASFVALMGAATSQISYTASKGGVLAMTRELGVQFAREGIRVNALVPRTGGHAAADGAVRQGSGAGGPAAGAHPDGSLRASRRRSPSAVAFLASDDASFITASTFLVDGGLTAAYVTPV